VPSVRQRSAVGNGWSWQEPGGGISFQFDSGKVGIHRMRRLSVVARTVAQITASPFAITGAFGVLEGCGSLRGAIDRLLASAQIKVTNASCRAARALPHVSIQANVPET